MNASTGTRHRRWLPRSMAARLLLILAGGLLVAHALSFGLLFYERYTAARAMLMSNIEQDVVVAVNLLDRTAPKERAQWLPMLRRRTFHYLLGEGDHGDVLPLSRGARTMVDRIEDELGPRYPVTARRLSSDPDHYQLHVRLRDGTPLTIDLRPSVMPLARWLPWVLLAQLGLLLLCTWLAVRFATRPLARLANAAETLRPSGEGERLAEEGPAEVANAAAAFNAMQDRIARFSRERMEILAAISHDLQTPITRMHLRAEALDETPERAKLLDDLQHMQHLVREGITYARSAHGSAEPAVRVDLDAFVESLVYDYRDTGRDVTFDGDSGLHVTTRLHALRRIVANLLDNAIKYAGAAEVEVARESNGRVRIAVRDRGPGIPEDALGQVMAPFYRLEASRNRDTGGTGLGLAIAQQLAEALGATLVLRNRAGGGLEAILALPGT
ncbi:MAG TPA: HAMP domain-containing sensor histidine kinase [Lysobacter sp.]|nr:HAMP domain-containing sensor histidine kinase [Lysobacter sp.]